MSQASKAYILIKLLFDILFQIILVPMFLVLVLGFPLLTHPLSIGVTLLVLVIVISLIIGIFYSTLWVSYATILILLGGLLVIFIYVSLLASNEVFKISNFFIIPATTSLFSLFFMIFGLSLYNEITSETLINSLKTLNTNSLD